MVLAKIPPLLKEVTVNRPLRQGLAPKDRHACPEDYKWNRTIRHMAKIGDSYSSNDKSNDNTFGRKIASFIVRGGLESKTMGNGTLPSRFMTIAITTRTASGVQENNLGLCGGIYGARS